PRHDQVRIPGIAQPLGDSEQPLIDDIWQENPLLRQYLGSSSNPELIIYRIIPEEGRFMREWALEYSTVFLSDNQGTSR
ncbi:MAG: hypothetical protein MK312_06740, partial [Roseibacillus sp.]|nr:hypothetical protein [Roseibacillus sp.]